MFCKNCGKEVADNAYVCTNCGCLVDESNQNKKLKNTSTNKNKTINILLKISLYCSFALSGLFIMFAIMGIFEFQNSSRSFGETPNKVCFILMGLFGILNLMVSIFSLFLGLMEKKEVYLKYICIAFFIIALLLIVFLACYSLQWYFLSNYNPYKR